MLGSECEVFTTIQQRERFYQYSKNTKKNFSVCLKGNSSGIQKPTRAHSFVGQAGYFGNHWNVPDGSLASGWTSQSLSE